MPDPDWAGTGPPEAVTRGRRPEQHIDAGSSKMAVVWEEATPTAGPKSESLGRSRPLEHAAPPQFSPAAPQFAPHPSNALPFTTSPHSAPSVGGRGSFTEG